MEEKPVKKGITEAQKRASKKYLENNRDKINQQRKRYYIERKEKDPEFLKYKREKAKEYYDKNIKKPKEEVKKDEYEAIKEEVKEDNKPTLGVEFKNKFVNIDFDIKF